MIVVIVGPTGVGKTALSLALAKTYNTEIISGDSVQIYRGMNIGSAKVTKEETKTIRHHLIDERLPNEPFSVAEYQTRVRELIDTFTQKNQLPLIVGGTGFYIKSVLHDFNFEGSHRPESFDEQYDDYDNESLFTLLEKADYEATKKIHPNNRKRVIQALYRASQGVPRSEQNNEDESLYDYLIIGLTMPREKLYERINQRVDQMVEDGLVDEVRHLYDTYGETQSLSAIGYKELIGYFRGFYSLETAIALIKTNTRRYAKRQYTYFNNQLDVTWIDVDLNHFDDVISQAKALIAQKKHE